MLCLGAWGGFPGFGVVRVALVGAACWILIFSVGVGRSTCFRVVGCLCFVLIVVAWNCYLVRVCFFFMVWVFSAAVWV